MIITPIGYILIPLGLLLFFLGSKPLFYAFVFFIPFSASAVVNIPTITFGLQIPYYFAILLMIRKTLDHLLGKRIFIHQQSKEALIPLFLFLLVVFISLVMPMIISGKVTAFSPEGFYTPVELTRLNITQVLYLVFMILVCLFTVFEINTQEIFFTSIKIYLISAFIVCVWGLLQPIESHLGIAYPSFLFNNNIGYYQGYGQIIGRIKRINSVAPEPSVFSYYLLSVLPVSTIALVKRLELFRNRITLPLFMLTFILTLLLSTSTTALIGMIFMLVVTTINYLPKSPRVSLKLLRVIFLYTVGAFILSGISLKSLNIKPNDYLRAIKTVTTGKCGTPSAVQRFSGFEDSMGLFLKYPILGVGWGSNRSFDLISNLLSNVGILGFSCFFLFFIFVYKSFRNQHRFIEDSRTKIAAEGLFMSLIVVLFINIITVPDLIFTHLWFLLGLLVSLPKIATYEECEEKEGLML